MSAQDKPLLEEALVNGRRIKMPGCDIFVPEENFYDGNSLVQMDLRRDFHKMLKEVGAETNIPPINIAVKRLTNRTTDLQGGYGPGVISYLGDNYRIYLYHIWRLISGLDEEWIGILEDQNFLYLSGTKRVVCITKCRDSKPYYRLDAPLIGSTNIRCFNSIVIYHEESYFL